MENKVHAEFDEILKYQLVAKIIKEDVTTIAEVQQFERVFEFFWGIESKREKQNQLPGKDELEEFRSWFDRLDVMKKYEALRANPHYFQDGKMRLDLKMQLADAMVEIGELLAGPDGYFSEAPYWLCTGSESP